MELSTGLRRFVWLLLAISQLWLLYRIEQLSASAHAPTILTPASAPHAFISNDDTAISEPVTGNLPVHAGPELQAALRRIEQRLAGLERIASTAGNRQASGTPASPTTPYQPSASEQAAADQRLGSLLPNGPLNREDVARFHATLQTLPADERFAMATALARAINDGRVQPAPGAF